jgi:hypothetical protein
MDKRDSDLQPDGGGSWFFRKIDNHLHDYTVSQLRAL